MFTLSNHGALCVAAASVSFSMMVSGHTASATTFLGDDLGTFAVLGAETVTNVPTSSIIGNVGVSPGTAVTGFNSVSGTATSDPQVTNGQVHSNTPLAQSAQNQLSTARDNLDSLGSGTMLAADLAGQTLTPGVYTVPAGTTNLSGTLTLDGGGNLNAGWVFQFPSTLITSPNSAVNVINTGSGAGLYWNVGSSATIDTNSTFLGNILAQSSVSANTTASIRCGRALADTGAVTLQMNTIFSDDCEGDLAGSDGLGGGLTVSDDGDVEFPSAAVPLPASSLLMLGALGGLGLVRRLRRVA